MTNTTENTRTFAAEKGCPGLPNSPQACGRPKKLGQGYCDTHTKEYQRNRYQAKMRERKAKGTIETRPYYGSSTYDVNKDRCPVCTYVKPGDIVTVAKPEGLPHMCNLCVEILNLYRTVGSGKLRMNFIVLAEFVTQPHIRRIFLAAEDDNLAFKKEVERRLKIIQKDEDWDIYEHTEQEHGGRVAREVEEDIDSGKLTYDYETETYVRAPKQTNIEQTNNRNIEQTTNNDEDESMPPMTDQDRKAYEAVMQKAKEAVMQKAKINNEDKQKHDPCGAV